MEAKIPITRHFFKVIMPGFHEKLSVPQAFCRYLIGEKTQSATLTSRNGSWRVKVTKCSKGFLYFEEGWDNFAKHHGLNFGDFVMFEHKGNMNFNVFVFDSSTCEKEFFVKSENKRERASPGKIKSESPLEAFASSRCEIPHFETTIKECNGMRRGYHMNIPAEFAKSNGWIHEISSVTLRDPSGKLWPVKLNTYNVEHTNRKRTKMGKGWSEFYSFNKLKEGDVCYFELNGTAKITTTVVMDVHFFPSPTKFA